MICDWLAKIYEFCTYVYTLYAYVWSERVNFCIHCNDKLNIPYVSLFAILLYLMRASAWITSWLTTEFHSHFNLEVSYIVCKVPTSLWLLVHVWTFLRYLSTFRVQSCLDGNNLYVKWTWLELYKYCRYGNYIVWNFITLTYLHLGLMSDYTQSYRKYLLSLRLSLLSGALYKPYKMVG